MCQVMRTLVLVVSTRAAVSAEFEVRLFGDAERPEHSLAGGGIGDFRGSNKQNEIRRIKWKPCICRALRREMALSISALQRSHRSVWSLFELAEGFFHGAVQAAVR